ncbi:hypothetical protein ACFRAO_34370 [Streptomyces sp. NPDC056656]|uniref:hypothetical protein n=1 Tax=Streptomyces sp. NPDC056656 TaxID=3345895 RepID=UPI00368E7189
MAIVIGFKKLTTKQVALVGIVFFYAATGAGGVGAGRCGDHQARGAGVVMIRRLADRVRSLLDLLARLGPRSRALVLLLVGRFGWGYVLGGFVVACYGAARYPQYRAACLVRRGVGACAQGAGGRPDEDDEPAVEEAPAEPVPADVADVVRDVIGTDRGAPLTTLRGPLGAAWECLDGADIPVRPGVRTAGGNGPGVHRDDVPAPRPISTDAAVVVVAAGEDANSNTNNKPTVVVREGTTIITDPADHHRRAQPPVVLTGAAIPMPYVYCCAQCGARSPEPYDQRDHADDERAEHRATEHGGLAPAAGDGLRAVHARGRTASCSGSLLFVLFLVAAVLANCWGR